MSVPKARVRAYCFTHNNYTEDDIQRYRDSDADYIAISKEVAPTTGTPHLQGYVYWKNKKCGAAVIKEYPGASFKVCNGTTDQNYVYITKAADIHYTHGVQPDDQGAKGAKEVNRWSDALQLARDGDFEAIASKYPQIYLCQMNALEKAYYAKDRGFAVFDGDMNGVWLYGNSGAGKTRFARAIDPDAYCKVGNNKWWGRYRFQKVIRIEDFDPLCKDMSFLMKNWTDRDPVLAEVKGSEFYIRPERFIVTSNYRIDQIWKDPHVVASMRRRFPFEMEITEDTPLYAGPESLLRKVGTKRLYADISGVDDELEEE